jgi:hypothetical protein
MMIVIAIFKKSFCFYGFVDFFSSTASLSRFLPLKINNCIVFAAAAALNWIDFISCVSVV